MWSSSSGNRENDCARESIKLLRAADLPATLRLSDAPAILCTAQKTKPDSHRKPFARFSSRNSSAKESWLHHSWWAFRTPTMILTVLVTLEIGLSMFMQGRWRMGLRNISKDARSNQSTED